MNREKDPSQREKALPKGKKGKKKKAIYRQTASVKVGRRVSPRRTASPNENLEPLYRKRGEERNINGVKKQV